MKIFAADDESLAREMLEEAIAEAAPEAEVRSFDKPSELLKEAEKNCPDVAFLDVSMPGMTGVELAEKLKEIKPKINIIFVTGYSEYMPEAMAMFASGYIMKPVDAEQIEKQLQNLRYEVSSTKVFVRTFGNFAVFCNNEPVTFRYAKSQELLAYLVDRRGAVVSRREIAAVIMEEGNYSRSEQKLLSRFAKELEKDLEAAGISEIFRREEKGYRVATDRIDCDMFGLIDGTGDEYYTGEYMEQYSWGEEFKARMDMIL